MKVKKMKKKQVQKLIALILALVSILAPCLSVLSTLRRSQHMVVQTSSTAQKSRKIPIYCVDTQGQKKVSLTFDSTWGKEDDSAENQKLLAILKDENVHATFFLIGSWMRKYPEIVKQIVADGHDVANHSDQHPQATNMQQKDIEADIMAAHKEIKNYTGQDCNLYRAPYGEYNNTVLEAAEACHYHTIQWDVDSIDWRGDDAATIVKRVLEHKHLGDGSIILLHNVGKHTVEALPDIIKGLKEKGFEIVPVSELIYKDNYVVDGEGRQSLEKEVQ